MRIRYVSVKVQPGSSITSPISIWFCCNKLFDLSIILYEEEIADSSKLALCYVMSDLLCTRSTWLWSCEYYVYSSTAALGRGMPCCRCNRTGSCKGCACVKAGKPCSNCLPSKLGSCANRSSMRSCVQQPSNPSNLSTPINAPPATGQPVTSTATAVSADYATISVKTASETPSSSTNSQPNTDAQQLSTVPTPINAPPATGL